MTDNGYSLEVGADLMAVLLFIFIIMISVMKPESDTRQRAESERLQKENDSLRTELRVIKNLNLTKSRSGTVSPTALQGLNVAIASFSYIVEFGGKSKEFRQTEELAKHLRGIRGDIRTATIYAEEKTPVQRVLSVYDIVKEAFPAAMVNMGVRRNSLSQQGGEL